VDSVEVIGVAICKQRSSTGLQGNEVRMIHMWSSEVGDHELESDVRFW